jgi:type I restriction enzyme S subunit
MEAVLRKVKFEKYPTYKPSGVDWLGEIPEHWETLANKYIFKLKKNQVGKKSSDFVLLSLTLNGVIKRDMENPQGKFPAEFNTYQEVKKGDFIFCLFDVEETPRTVGLSGFDGMITGAYTVMQPDENFDKGFLYYFYLNLDADKRMKPLYTGLRNTISKDNFFSFRSFVPPLSEQTAIATFLDNKTALIDKAIAIKQKQIELLKERRQILIHNAVTRGLNPDVKMKDSGVEWIGEIPEHWEVKRLKYVLNINNGSDYKHIQTDEGFPVIGSGGQFAYASEYMYDGEVVFLGRKGTIDKPLYFNGKFWAVDTMFYAISKNDNNTRFLYYVATTIPFKLYSTATALPSMTQSDLNNHIIAIPPFNEQIGIADYIDVATTKIATAISLKEKEIEKLKEYKSVLINSAVTGKIKIN